MSDRTLPDRLRKISPPAPIASPEIPGQPEIRGTVRVGVIVLGAFLALLIGWGALAPLISAAVAPGTVRVDSNRKTIQHLEGGIIGEILVDNGDEVEEGQVLVQLNDAQARSAYQVVQGQHDALQAAEARLIAEREEHDRIAFPPELESRRDDPEIQEILNGQEAIFDSRKKSYKGQVDILRQRIEELNSEIDSRLAQVRAADRQKALIGEEISGVAKLVKKGLERKARLLALQREAANLDGARGEQNGLIARAKQQIGEAELQVINLRNNHLQEIASELRDVQTKLRDLDEKLYATRNVLERQEIRAPISGTVVDQRFFTPGGVIGPGEAILDIVPRNDELIVEARVQPTDIDVVRVGLEAKVNFNAFKQRTTPTLVGAVSYVSADIITDQRSGVSYYIARIRITADELARLDGRDLYPGMPAQVMIVTGERTALQYLIDPLTDSIRAAFTEQ